MKIIREPKVYLVGKQIVTSGLTEFLNDEGVTWDTNAPSAGEYLVEAFGRNCYQSYKNPRPGGNKAYIDHILEVGHGSVTEAAVWNFMITGVSRSFSHEFVRHRHISPAQLSQRYVDESVAEYVEPDIIAEDPELHAIWQDAVEHCHEAYVKLSEKLYTCLENDGYARYLQAKKDEGLKEWSFSKEEWLRHIGASGRTEIRKAARQAARSVLPNATETKIAITVNARAIRGFLELRASRHAEVEIRKVANKMYEILLKESPNLFSDYEKVSLPDGTFELITKFRKV